jgi:hypothetical protein
MEGGGDGPAAAAEVVELLAAEAMPVTGYGGEEQLRFSSSVAIAYEGAGIKKQFDINTVFFTKPILLSLQNRSIKKNKRSKIGVRFLLVCFENRDYSSFSIPGLRLLRKIHVSLYVIEFYVFLICHERIKVLYLPSIQILMPYMLLPLIFPSHTVK